MSKSKGGKRLNACPVCGTKAEFHTKLITDPHPPSRVVIRWLQRGACPNKECQLSGPLAETDMEAAALWNRLTCIVPGTRPVIVQPVANNLLT